MSAKFRRNHQQSSATGGMAVKVGLFAGILTAMFWVYNNFFGTETTIEEEPSVLVDTPPKGPGVPGSAVSEAYLPSSTTGQVIKHAYYALSYNEEHEQAEWVAYKLDRDLLRAPNVERTNNFRPDPKVRKASASHRDYSRSGYDRGHLVPAADMAHSEEAMSETFYMSNISPQIRNFNSGIWRELEENTRYWANKFGELYIVTGPVLSRGIRDQIGDNEVSVPDEFYKVLLDVTEPEIKAIAFIIPNEVSDRPISDFAVSIDQVESITGIDFYPNLLEDELEEQLEADFDTDLWPLSDSKYRLRLEKWNKQK